MKGFDTIERSPNIHRYSSLPQPMSNDNAVIQNEVDSGGIVGRFFRPSADDIRGAIIVLGGSGGGLGWSGDVAAQLCAEGYAALALAYSRWPGRPKKLVGIRLEYVASAIRWLQRTIASAASPVAIIGASRGTELALLAASKFSQVRVVVAVAPSSVLWGPDSGIATIIGRPAWTFGGLALPAMRSPSAWWPPRRTVDLVSSWMSGTPWRNTPLVLESLQDVEAVCAQPSQLNRSWATSFSFLVVTISCGHRVKWEKLLSHACGQQAIHSRLATSATMARVTR